jgi:ribonuclease HII
VEDSVTLTSEELKRVGKDVLEDCRDQVGNLIRATIGSLTSEVQAIAEEYRRQHLGKFQEITNKCMREIETSVQQAMRREKETFLRQLEDEVEASAARAAIRIKAQSEAAAQQASDKIYRQVGEAAVVLKEWADQARERFDARTRGYLETFQKQAEELSKASLDKARGQASNLEKSLAARLLEAANLLQAPEPEGSQRKASEVSEPTTQSDPKR